MKNEPVDWKEVFFRLRLGNNLNEVEARKLVEALLNEITNPLLLTGLLAGWQAKKAPTAEEVAGAVKAIRSNQQPIEIKPAGRLVDIVGTGGGDWSLFNISTGTAFIAAAAGARVAKHCGGGISNNAGSTNVLDELGIVIDKQPKELAIWLEECNLAFLPAKQFCPKLGKLTNIRRGLAIPTIFNYALPLANPAKPSSAVIGVAEGIDERALIKAIIDNRLIKRACLVRHESGADELCLEGTTFVWEIRGGKLESYQLTAKDFGLSAIKNTDITVENVAASAFVIKEVLGGGQTPHRPVLVANAALALYVGGWTDDLKTGVLAAEAAIKSGKALKLYADLVTISSL